jgi:hypothetical protein
VPQQSKAMPIDPDALEIAPGSVHAELQGTLGPMASEPEVRATIEQAFGYRGDVTLTLKDGRVCEGYLFDRRVAPVFAECRLRVIPRDQDQPISISYNELAGVAFTGRDAAAGKSFETWVKKYRQKKAAGESNIRLEPEKLE